MNLFRAIIPMSLIVAATLSSGCGSTSSLTKDAASTAVTKSTVSTDYATLVYAMYSDSIAAAEDLQTAVNTFVDNPTQETFDASKQAWLEARHIYSQTEGFRFYNGPIDASPADIELRINSWPIDELYIDYVASDASAGIINDTAGYPTFNATLLKEKNTEGGEKNISTGYHAIEFLLWGQDLSSGTGAGLRPYTDYLTVGGTASNQARRGDFLKMVVANLIEDLYLVRNQWTPGGANYRSTWEASDTNTTLGNIFNGIATLAQGELANERMRVAIEVQDREEEQSCFSDNTKNDIIDNILSVQNVYLGRFDRYGGGTLHVRSLYDLALTVNPTLANQIKADLETAITQANAIVGPFDQEILDSNTSGQARLNALITTLTTIGANLSSLSIKLTGSAVVGDGD